MKLPEDLHLKNNQNVRLVFHHEDALKMRVCSHYKLRNIHTLRDHDLVNIMYVLYKMSKVLCHSNVKRVLCVSNLALYSTKGTAMVFERVAIQPFSCRIISCKIPLWIHLHKSSAFCWVLHLIFAVVFRIYPSQMMLCGEGERRDLICCRTHNINCMSPLL